MTTPHGYNLLLADYKGILRRDETVEEHGLSKREVEIVRLLSLGCTVKETAKLLNLAPSTVDNHKMRAMWKLGTDKVVLLARLAIWYGITTPEETLTPAEKRKSGRPDDGWN